MTPRLKKIIIIGAIAVILVAVLGVYLNAWTIRKMDKISLGLAEPNFPYRDYTEAELAKMYPQIKNADVATRTTPEETYAKFRQALKDNNLEMAIEQLSKDSGRYKENKEALTKAHEEGKFMSISESYPQKIEKENMYEARAQFYFLESDGEEVSRYPLDFIKNSDGDWKIDIL
jgi:hypothetical protein